MKLIVWTAQAIADVRSIDQPVAIQILKTLARYASSGEGDTKQLQGVDPPLVRLRAQNHRVFLRDKGSSWRSPAFWIAKKPTAETLAIPY